LGCQASTVRKLVIDATQKREKKRFLFKKK
jgi:hypothetical protein